MAAAASDLAADWQRFASWDHVTVTAASRGQARANHPPAAACRRLHSYVADGRQLCWRLDLPGQFALDAEINASPPPHLSQRWAGTGTRLRREPARSRVWPSRLTAVDEDRDERSEERAEFWDAWTTAEVVAKLCGLPMLTLVGRGLPTTIPAGVETLLTRRDDLVACFGRLVPIVM